MSKEFDQYLDGCRKVARNMFRAICLETREGLQWFAKLQRLYSVNISRDGVRLKDCFYLLSQELNHSSWDVFKSLLKDNMRTINANYYHYKKYYDEYDKICNATLYKYESYDKLKIDPKNIKPFPFFSDWVQNNRCQCNNLNFSGLDFSIYDRDNEPLFSYLCWAELNRCKFQRAKFFYISFAYAECNSCNFAYAEFVRKLRDGRFSRGDFERANFIGCNCANAVFNGSYMRGANFANTSLRYAQLEKVQGYDINLRNADLTGANLLGADISLHALSQAKSISGVILPDGSEY
ncbi:MAG: pentapeptide repeat-containing protein [Gammaproteobacteria bacterium]|nr:pentapeptide repeat-containing protein [Gammaproteobacteria bacterium]